MKKITYILTCLVLGAISFSCTDQSTFNNPVTHELERGAFAKVSAGSIPNVVFDPMNIDASAEIVDSNNNISEYVLMLEANISGDILHQENFVTFTSFPATINITSQNLADALGISVSDIAFGNSFRFIAKVTRNDGTVFYGSAPTYDTSTGTVNIGNTEPNLYLGAYNDAMEFLVALACPPSPPGEYRIEMHDSFGDGWQTNDGNAGNGIMITVDGVVTEVGMCSPYNDSQAAFCVPGDAFDATGYVDIPAGAEIILWEFPGDQYGEIFFEIYDPNGELVGEYGQGHPAGLLILCDSDLGS
jgi:hypothetical protein